MNDIIMHINYGEIAHSSYGRNSIEDIVKMATGIGYDGIEFRTAPPKELSELSFEAYTEEIGRCKQKHGMKAVVMASTAADAFGKNENERGVAIEGILKKVETANKICGVTLFNALGVSAQSPVSSTPIDAYEYHGSAAISKEGIDEAVEIYQIIGKRLVELGVKFAFETHMFYIHDLPQATKDLVDLIDSPAIGINMDFGNTVYFPTHPTLEETIHLYQDKLFYTHLKNSVAVPDSKKRIATSLSEGEINHREYLRMLKETGFEGAIGIEAPRAGDRTWYAKQDFNYAKSVINDLNERD